MEHDLRRNGHQGKRHRPPDDAPHVSPSNRSLDDRRDNPRERGQLDRSDQHHHQQSVALSAWGPR